MSETVLSLPIRRRDPLERAAEAIEARLFAPLNVAELARVAGLSPYHFSRQFTARYGTSVMAYVRARRLAAAARQLAGEDPPALVELAFECGFDSQEGFTRAFKRAFGVTPGRFRRGGHGRRHDEGASRLQLTMELAPRRRAGLRIAGLQRVFNDTNRHEIPKLWSELFRLAPRRPGQVSYGVCWGVGQGGAMGYMAGAALGAEAALPDGLTEKTVPEQSYLVFRQRLDGGEIHRQMHAAAREIWGRRLPAFGARLAEAPDLEVYPADFRADRPGACVEWWVPTRP